MLVSNVSTTGTFAPGRKIDAIISLGDLDQGGVLSVGFRTPPTARGEVVGRVVDAMTQSPIAGAAVVAGDAVSSTEGDGRYILENVTPGPVMVAARASGYRPFKGSPVSVLPEETAMQEIAMQPMLRPVARIGGPYHWNGGLPVAFDAGGSYDPDGAILLYEWDWNGDGISDERSESPFVSHTWEPPYGGIVTVRVVDNDQCRRWTRRVSY